MTNAYKAPTPGQRSEEDFPEGHPARSDFNPRSDEAKEWVRRNVSTLGERDFPVDHPKAADTPSNVNNIVWAAGVDPFNAHLEPFTGRTPEQAAAVLAMSIAASKAAKESPVLQPLDALDVARVFNAKRKELGRDVLTPEEYAGVLATIRGKLRPQEDPAVVEKRISEQHQALTVLISKGYARQTALEMIGLEGADKILARFPAAE